MIAFFDYVFFKVHRFYSKKNYIPVAMGIYFLIVTQICIIFSLGIAFNFATGGLFSSESMHKTIFYSTYGVIIGGFAFLNIKRYANSKVRKALEAKFHIRRSIPMWVIFMIPIFFLSVGLALIFTLTSVK
ncbi:hypothetical protein O71_10939 [Pontibacter sp. BAB1700]|nr:hypothetical protein O71_10939 [Pontibacter sp. BAB1700]